MDTYDTIDIVVVEDDQDDSELTLAGLRRGNTTARIKHVWDGTELIKFITDVDDTKSREGLRMLNQLKFILLNLNMPKLDGLEVLKKIRKYECMSATPVVIFSASKHERAIAQAYESGANSYVVKPSRFEMYMDTVSSVAFYWSVINEKPNIMRL